MKKVTLILMVLLVASFAVSQGVAYKTAGLDGEMQQFLPDFTIMQGKMSPETNQKFLEVALRLIGDESLTEPLFDEMKLGSEVKMAFPQGVPNMTLDSSVFFLSFMMHQKQLEMSTVPVAKMSVKSAKPNVELTSMKSRPEMILTKTKLICQTVFPKILVPRNQRIRNLDK